MHTRRLASFLVGAWMLASLILGFISVQNMTNVDRILSSPPGPVAKDIEDLGTDIAEHLRREALDRGLRADRHEDGRLDFAVRRGDTARPGGAIAMLKGDMHQYREGIGSSNHSWI